MKTNSKAIQFLSRVLLTFALVALGLTSPGTTAAKPPTGPTCDVSVSVTFRDAMMSDSVRSDNGGPYDGGIACDGDFGLGWKDSRTVVFDLTNPISGSPPLGPVNAEGNLGVEIDNVDVTGGGLLGMAVGEWAATTKVQFNFVVGPTRYFLQLGSRYEGASTATVTRTGEGTWEIEAGPAPNDIARLQSCRANGRCIPTTVGTYHAPFKMTLIDIAPVFGK